MRATPEECIAQAAREAAAPAALRASRDDDDADEAIVSPLSPKIRAHQRAVAREVVRLALNLRRAGTHEYSRAVVAEMLRLNRHLRDLLLPRPTQGTPQ